MRPGVAIAVRGTEFDIDATPNGPATVIVIKGVVEISDKIKGKEKKVKAGEKVMITTDGEVKESLQVDLRLVKRWWED